MCPPMRAHWERAYWRNLTNTIELVLPVAHPSPQPKRQIDQFTVLHSSRQNVPILYNGMPPQNCPFPWDESGPPSNAWFQPCAHPSPQLKRHLKRFSRICRAHYCDRQCNSPPTKVQCTRAYSKDFLIIRTCGGPGGRTPGGRSGDKAP